MVLSNRNLTLYLKNKIERLYMKNNLPLNILKSQSEACKSAIKYLLAKVFLEGRPADKVLSDFFKNNRKYGSRDRRLMLDVSFAVFRWWGWIKVDLSKNLLKQFEDSSSDNQSIFVISNAQLTKIILIACILDNLESIPKEILSLWTEESGVKLQANRPVIFDSDMLKLIDSDFIYKSDSSGQSCKLSIDKLIPKCALEFLPENIDINKLISYFQKRPPMWLRAQTNKIDELILKLKSVNMDAHLSKIVKGAIQINDPRVNLYTLDEFKEGKFEVQDLASQAIGLVCNPKPGERWWDSCAGAGGKSLQLSFLMYGKGSVTASDIREYKLDDLKRRARRAAVSNIRCTPWNGKALKLKKQNNFDGVLVDAPCSCSGTWRRNPDARWNTSVKDINEITKIQTKILQNAATGVKPNGILVYATCSVFTEENQKIVDKFLKSSHNFELEPFINPLTGAKTNGTAQILPWDGNCDATFIAKFRKLKK